MVQRAPLMVFLVLLIGLVSVPPASSQARVDRNVVYGMHSGLALLMDVYHPGQPNGYGVVFIWGSGWHAPLAQSAGQLKARGSFPPLTDAGYTVFVINHRAAPRFRYPAAVEDAQRAVRFIRHHAAEYGISPNRIGGIGGSSGAHLVSMLGTLDDRGNPEDPDPVNQVSAKLQAVVSFAGPSDLATLQSASGPTAVASFVGMPPPRPRRNNTIDTTSEEYRTYWEASPANHASRDDAPFLLIHGDADATVPFEQAGVMEQALTRAGVERRLVRVPDGPHGVIGLILQEGSLPTAAGRFEVAEVIGWFDRHLRKH